jgi:CheY-like chemotaxis protein
MRRVLGLEPGQRSYRLLVVEDRDTNRQLLVRLLAPLGFEIREAVDGQQALELWERWQPDLILMDMRMPLMDGHEATRRIKATARGKETIIIALTSSAFEEDRERILGEGCDDFVRKPFRTDEILDILARHLGVCFVYETAGPAPTPQPEVTARTSDASMVDRLAELPASWITDLQEATIRADLGLMLVSIDRIRERDTVLADALAQFAQGYNYRAILAWIEEAGEDL